jgi:hypothetical protein
MSQSLSGSLSHVTQLSSTESPLGTPAQSSHELLSPLHEPHSSSSVDPPHTPHSSTSALQAHSPQPEDNTIPFGSEIIFEHTGAQSSSAKHISSDEPVKLIESSTPSPATINSASGGAAGDAGFMVSSSATTALGFSLSGATIPAGEGVMVVLGLDGSPTGLSEIIVSDPVGVDMSFTYDDGGIVQASPSQPSPPPSS